MKKHKNIVAILVATLLFTAISLVACTDDDKKNGQQETTSVTSSVNVDKTEGNDTDIDNHTDTDTHFIEIGPDDNLSDVVLVTSQISSLAETQIQTQETTVTTEAVTEKSATSETTTELTVTIPDEPVELPFVPFE